jgi:hypothetical protein
MPETCEIDKAAENLQKAAKSPNNEKALAEALFDYLEAKENCSDALLYQFGLLPDKALIETLAGIQKKDIWEDVVRAKAKEYLEEARKQESKLDYKKRRERIMSALRLLRRLHEERESLKPETLTLLAGAYLRMSRIIYPKGRTIPAKKIEAIDEGIKYAKESIERATNKENAYRCKGMLYVEKERILEKDERTDEELSKIKNALNEALDKGCTRFNLKEDVKIATVYSELSSELGENDKSYLKGITESDAMNIELEKARAYKLNNDENEVKNFVSNLITRRLRKTHFSDPLWDDTVRFLVRLYKANKEDSSKFSCWNELSQEAWKTCQEIEKDIIFPFHIRWYWSKMRDLYDLAFLAAGDDKTKAIVADSLKSRPSMKLNVIEKLTEDDKLMKDIFNEYAIAYMEGYSKEYDELKKKIEEYKKKYPNRFRDLSRVRDIEKVPTGWIVIHFYLNQLEEQGYALIYDNSDTSKSENEKWEKETFKFDELFNAYITWQTHYTRNKEGASFSLVKLCEKIGEDGIMGFLFNPNIIPSEKPVLFIPHDFLHRLPLHGAIKTENGKPKEVFLQRHSSCYLPAWGILKKKDTVSVTSGKYILQDRNEFVDIQWDGKYQRFEELPNNPEFLFISCHGKADSVNPFNARLKINGSGKTYLDIRKSDKTFTGTHLILGACETDLVSPLSDVIDEHLSISTVFLDKNTTEIIGTMWLVIKEDIDKLVKKMIDKCCNSDLWMMKELWAWQKELISNYPSSDIYDFNRAVVFRAIGFIVS